jgi:hypothetical protein
MHMEQNLLFMGYEKTVKTVKIPYRTLIEIIFVLFVER